MNSFEIIPDSSCDMTESIRKKFGINHIIRGVVYKPDGTQILADIDWKTTSPEDYYNSMKGRKVLYKTATPPMGEIIDVFEPVLKSGKDILSISLSSSISGTYNAVKNVAEDLLKKYPERKIICVDSLRYSSATALLITYACEKRDSGSSIEETAEYINELKHSIHQMGPLDDLFFCVKTGRITNFQAFFGTLIGVNSLGDFGKGGLAAVLGKVKGHQTALDITLKYIKQTIKNPEEQIIFIGHSNREKSANILAERIRESLNPKDIIINPIGMSCGASIGPGLCAAYYIGSPISDGEADERILMEKLIKENNTKKTEMKK